MHTKKTIFLFNSIICFILFSPVSASSLNTFLNRFKSEPNISDVHKWAIYYAEVNQEKVKNWRKLAKKKAWFPKVSLGLDGDKKRSVSDSIWGSYSSGGQHYNGPDDKSFNSNFSWDASFTWELSDIIWNSDLATIDSRSRSIVRLRENILGQVTRLYFERRRIQIMIQSENELDNNSLIEHKLRISELTALIDGFTNGKFSKNIKFNNYAVKKEEKTNGT